MATEIDYSKCNACGICYNDCPMDVFGWDEEKHIPFVNYPDECCYCGNCEIYCPKKAIYILLPATFY